MFSIAVKVECSSIMPVSHSVYCLVEKDMNLLQISFFSNILDMTALDDSYLFMVGVDSGSMYRRTHSLSRLAWSWVGGRLALFYIHQMNRLLSQWLWHDDSTINTVLNIIIIIIIKLLFVTRLKD